MLSKCTGGYADLRYELKTETKIVISGKEIIEVSSCPTDGFVLRLLKNRALACVTFTKEKEFARALRIALSNVRVLAKNQNIPVEFARVPIVKDRFIPELNEDPTRIDIEAKIALLRHYNEIPYQNKNIIHTDLVYNEVVREKFYANTEGSEVFEKLVTTRIAGTIMAGDGSLIQSIRVGIGGSNGFAILQNREDEFINKTKLVGDLLTAEPVSGGVYNVILNQNLAGVFTHEAFGHFSEADLIENNPTMRKKMALGARLGTEILNIIDDPTIPGQLGFYKYDDEGVMTQPVQLLKNGILVGRLHSRQTAAAFNEPPNGHCVAEDYRFPPIIRMGTIFIQPADNSLEELLSMLGSGLYLCDAMGGQTSGENFTFAAQYGYIVENGRITKMVRDINISGNLYQTLNNIQAVGSDLKLGEVGGCGKGQLNIRSCYGAPHILLKDAVIGGR
ncbi:MAG: TldD/PmbA family protein [candidate division WOR-3 bacterium]